jgi:hypothetical protein
MLSKQKSARRTSLTDTDNNAVDFEQVDWRVLKDKVVGSLIDFYRPKNQAYGAWNPASVPAEIQPAVGDATILIWQVYGTGNKATPAVSHSFIELYNTTDRDIDLTGYAIQYSASGNTWEKLDLAGSIPAHTSYLIRGKGRTDQSRLDLSDITPDESWDIDISNSAFKICLVYGTEAITTENPYNIDGNGTKLSGYVDMIGVGEAFIDGYEWVAYGGDNISKNIAARRKSLSDTDNNAHDFIPIDYRHYDAAKGQGTDNITSFVPRTTADGAWNPVTGSEI